MHEANLPALSRLLHGVTDPHHIVWPVLVAAAHSSNSFSKFWNLVVNGTPLPLLLGQYCCSSATHPPSPHLALVQPSPSPSPSPSPWYSPHLTLALTLVQPSPHPHPHSGPTLPLPQMISANPPLDTSVWPSTWWSYSSRTWPPPRSMLFSPPISSAAWQVASPPRTVM